VLPAKLSLNVLNTENSTFSALNCPRLPSIIAKLLLFRGVIFANKNG